MLSNKSNTSEFFNKLLDQEDSVLQSKRVGGNLVVLDPKSFMEGEDEPSTLSNKSRLSDQKRMPSK
jgi:hypothetical protein